MATKEEWEQRIEDSGEKLRMEAIEWQAMEDLMSLGLTYAEAGKIASILSGNNICAVMLRTLCSAHSVAFTPSSDQFENLYDRFDEVIQKYAEHRANQDLNEAAEAESERRQSIKDAVFASC